MKFDRRELAGAVADVGVLVPIAVALIVSNGLSATAVLLPAGLLYIAAAFTYVEQGHKRGNVVITVAHS